jgi:hypothetical protein
MLLSVAAGVVCLTGTASAVPQELVDDLGNESYQLREKAEKELTLWTKKEGEKAVDELDKMKEKVVSPEVRSRLESVIQAGYKAIPGTRGFMGISMNPVLGAAIVESVTPGTPAEKAGFRPNDKILELDGVDLTKKQNHLTEAMDFLRIYVKDKKAGEKLVVKIERNGEELTKELKLADYDKFMGGRIDPFGGGGNNFNQRIEIKPMMGGAQGNLRVMPQLNLNPKGLKENELRTLKLRIEINEQLFEGMELPDDVKGMLKLKHEKSKKRIEELEKELKKGEKK